MIRDLAALLVAVYLTSWAWSVWHQPPVVLQLYHPTLVISPRGDLATETDRILLGDLCLALPK